MVDLKKYFNTYSLDDLTKNRFCGSYFCVHNNEIFILKIFYGNNPHHLNQKCYFSTYRTYPNNEYNLFDCPVDERTIVTKYTPLNKLASILYEVY